MGFEPKRLAGVSALVLLLLALLGWGIRWFLDNHRWETLETRVGVSVEARRNPWLAAERFLRRLGRSVESQSGRRLMLQPPATPGVLIVKHLARALPEDRERILVDWIRAGGHLVLGAGNPNDAGAAALRERFRANQKREVPAGIHTKSFVIDREQALIGSFNLDPRSRELNSEIGLMVDSAEFAGEVAALMDTEFDLRNSYRLFLDEKGRLRWETVDADGQRVVFTHDPHASAWKRGLARFLSWLPIEQEL